MYGLYSAESAIVDRVRAALPNEVGIATASWREFSNVAPRADCLLVGSHWISAEIRAPLRAALLGVSPVPLIIVTNKDADNARSAMSTGATHIVWLGEVNRTLYPLLRTLQARRVMRRAAVLLEGSSHLSLPLRTALASACRSDPPIRSVGELAVLFGRDRRTLWRHWHRANGLCPGLRLEDFLDWVLLLHGARLKTAKHSWAGVAEALGTHEHTLARIAARLAQTSLSKFGERKHEDLEVSFLETVVRPLTYRDLD